LEQSVGVIALHDRAIISVRGDDASEWLQGQLTNQVEGLEAGSSVYAFVLTLKGRIMADVFALVRADDVWLDVPAAQVDALLGRLDRYIIMEDVDLTPLPDLRVITAQGPRADEVADQGWPADRLGTGGREWVITERELASTLEAWTARARDLGGGALSAESWSDAHVVRGRPRFGVDFGDWTYPQESGLTPIAVSFTKGCYIGQETVVMLENRGKAPKVLWRWAIEASEPPGAGTPITSRGAEVGEITSAVVEEGAVAALGFLKRGCESEDGGGFLVEGVRARALGPVVDGPGVGSAPT
jgi:folate-binding protein YgfZ